MIYAFVPRSGNPGSQNEEVHEEENEDAKTVNSEQIERERKFRKICDKMFDTYHRKNIDYGNAFGESFKEFGMASAVIRLGDKYRRIRSLTNKENLVKDESVKDTLLDLANYAIMTLIEMEND